MMIQQTRLGLAFIGFLLMLAACSLPTVSTSLNEEDQVAMDAAMKELDAFLVPAIGVDYDVSCKARIITETKSYSGSCHLILTRNHELRLTVIHPLGGAVLTIYADRESIRVHDHAENSSHSFKATERRRLKIPIVKDLSLVELQAILWGRMTAEAGESLTYELEEGKPVRMYKKGKGIDLFVVYGSWLEHNQLQFPKIIEIKNRLDHSSVKLAVTRFQPGYSGTLKRQQP